ncbi:MAG TPA: hypothetical protein VG144_00425 [Gaiellaceae bacterium]|nr:hypothetical protein [Gaiellaceae bacterium]
MAKTKHVSDPAKQQLKKSREAGKKMNESGAKVVQGLRTTARRMREANGR